MKLTLKSDIFDEIYRTGEDGIPEFKNYIDGQWICCESEQYMEIHSPIDGSLLARVTTPNQQTLQTAVDKAYNKGRKAIRSFQGQKRVEVFLKAATLMKGMKDEFLDVLIKTAGKPVSNATGEVNATIERLNKTTMENTFLRGDYIPGDWSEETYETRGIVKKVPFGLILTIGPFNYPLYIPSSKIIPSILVGNAVFLKPASAAPIAPLMLTRVLEEAGLPKCSLNTLTVPGRDMNVLLESRKFEAVSFTGSTWTGEKIIKAAGIKNFHMELGGKDPVIVLKDAALDLATEKIVQGMVKYAGQRCDAVKLVFAVPEIYDDLKGQIVTKLQDIKSKNPLEDRDAIMGPLIDDKSADLIEDVYHDAIEKQATNLTSFHRDGKYIDPILLEVEKETLSDLDAFTKEIFGPLTLLIKVDTGSEAVKLANTSRFGLDASIFGEKESEILKLANALEVGAVFVNEYPRHGIGYYPFGGMKDSGIGREGIGYSVHQLTTIKTIVNNFKGYGVWEEL